MEKIKGCLYLTGGFALAGSSVIAARLVTDSLGTFTTAGVSLFFATLSLMPVCGKGFVNTIKGMKRRDWAPVLLQALFGIFLFRLFLLQGLIRTSTAEAGILTGATPAITTLLAVILLREPLYKTRVAGLCTTVAGILLLQGLLMSGNGFQPVHFAGNLLVLCAAACESIFNVLSRVGFLKAGESKAGSDPLLQTALVSCTAFFMCLGPAFTEEPVRGLARLNAVQWLALLWYGVAVTALAFFLWYAGIKRCEASIAAVFSGMMPFTALLLSVTFLGEKPDLQQYLGGFLVIAGMAVSGWRRKAEQPAPGRSRHTERREASNRRFGDRNDPCAGHLSDDQIPDL